MILSTVWQKVVFTDTLETFRIDQRDRDAQGDYAVALVRRVAGFPIPCKWHATDNYDEDSSPAGQSKQNNIFTSDKCKCAFSADVRAEDYVRITLGLDGKQFWFTVAALPKQREILAYQHFFMTATPAPTVNGDALWGV